jgi:hypothetical protein
MGLPPISRRQVLKYRKEVKIMINPILTNEYENEILELIDSQDQYTRSDLQGIVTVLVNKIMEEGYKIISDQKRIG